MSPQATLAICLAVLLCLSGPVAAQQYHIIASGTTTIAAIMQTLGFAYQAVDTSSIATYTITSSGSGQANALAGSSDYTSTNSIPTKSAMGGLQFPSSAYRIKSLIHTGDALIPMYNIPGFNQDAPLYINQEMLYGIWNNDIKWWNDTRLINVNPTANARLATITERIRIIYRPDAAGTTVPWTINLNNWALKHNSAYGYRSPTTGAVLYNVTPSTAPSIFAWPFFSPSCCCSTISGAGCAAYSSVTTCPSMSSCAPYMIPAIVSTYFTATRYLTTPYSTCYMARPIGIPYGGIFFVMYNDANNPVTPTTTSVVSAFNTPASAMGPGATSFLATLDMAQSPSSSLLQSIGSTNPDAWPITEYNVVVFNNNVHTDCFRALAVVQFLVWSFNSETAIAAIDFLLATQPPKDVVMANLDILAKTTCGMNGQFLVFDTVFPYETKIFVAAVVFAVIFWCLAIAVLYKNRHPAIRRVGVVTLVASSIAFGLNLFTVLLWLGYPTMPICQARPWVSATSFVVIYGAIIYIFQDRIFNRVDFNAMVDETIGAESQRAAADLKDLNMELATSTGHVSRLSTGTASSGSSGGAAANVKTLSTRVIMVFMVGLVNFLIPIVWVAVEPPTMQTRQCTGSFAQAFRQAMLFYNIILLVICTFGALFNSQRAQATSLPIHIFLLAASLFVPTNFLFTVGTTFSIPDRSFLGIALSPAIGILVSNIIIGLLVVMPPLVRAFTTSAEDDLSVLMVETQVDSYKSRSKSVHA